MKILLGILLFLGMPIYAYDIVPNVLHHNGFGDDDLAQRLINYAYDKGQDIDFVKTLNAENGAWDHLLQSRVIGPDGKREQSFGLCQLGYRRHKRFIDSDDFQDPYKQLDYCWEVWLDGKSKGRMPFNAYRSRDNRGWQIVFQQNPEKTLFLISYNGDTGNN